MIDWLIVWNFLSHQHYFSHVMEETVLKSEQVLKFPRWPSWSPILFFESFMFQRGCYHWNVLYLCWYIQNRNIHSKKRIWTDSLGRVVTIRPLYYHPLLFFLPYCRKWYWSFWNPSLFWLMWLMMDSLSI